ncbi:MAG: hypothetical protein HON70_17190, partial [Lentisphaerae bacterium]|nr:hypothetical protein [Lentisphaerota bacterium]
MVQLRLVLFGVFIGLGLTAAGQLAQPSGAVIPGSPAWVTKVEADAPAEAGAGDPSYGAESNPTGEPIGGGTGYRRLV